MKKVLVFVVPVILIFIGFNIINNSNANNASSCNLTADEYIEANKENAVIIDVRTQREYEDGHLENAVLIDIYGSSFKVEIAKLDKTKKYYVYCKTGIRSRNAVNYMIQNGFENVCNIEGGLNYLARAGANLVK